MEAGAMDAETASILEGGFLVKSYEGTSQYSLRGISACGLASFNAVRCILEAEIHGCKGPELMKLMMSRQLVDDATEICRAWSSSAHLEVEEICDLPLFHRTLRMQGSDFRQASLNNFTAALQRLESIGSPTDSSAAIITKPPEILAVFAIATQQPSPHPSKIFVVFDSHARPDLHPNGAAFTFFGTLQTAAAYLSDLLSVDPAVLSDPRMQWQAQLLSQCSFHLFTARSPEHQLYPGETTLPDPLYEANIAILELKYNLSELKSSSLELETRNDQLYTENERLKGELDRLRKEFGLLSKALDGGHGTETKDPNGGTSNGKAADKGKGRQYDQTSSPLTTNGDPVSWVDKPLGLPSLPNPLDYVPAAIFNAFTGPTPAEAHQAHSSRGSDSSKSQKLTKPHPTHQISYSAVASSSGKQSDYEIALALQQEYQILALKDTQLAAQTQREYDREAEVLRAQHYSLLSTQQRRFECGICLEVQPEDVETGLEGCDHLYCRSCLKEYVKSRLKDHKFPIICPMCAAAPSKTREGAVITHETLEILGVAEKEYNKWVELKLGESAVLLDCSKCRKSGLVDRDDYKAATIITCPLGCTNMWCKACSKPVDSPFESDHSCDGTVELESVIQQEGLKRCPTCKIPTQRTFGCHHMTCSVPGCNTHYCYRCGNFICKTQNAAVAKAAVDKHYQGGCSLFEIPEEGQDAAVPHRAGGGRRRRGH